MAQIFQAMLLGPFISMTGSKNWEYAGETKQGFGLYERAY